MRIDIQGEWMANDYVFAMLDIQGQGKLLRHLEELWRSGERGEQYVRAMESTFGKRRHLRLEVEMQMGALAELHESIEKLVTSAGDEADATAFGGDLPTCFAFSDSLAISAKLRPSTDGAKKLHWIYQMLVVVSRVYLNLLRTGVVVRGGVAFGMAATDGGDKELYGPALHRAYELESKCADYPRIVVGREVLELLRDLNKAAPDTKSGRNQNKWIKEIQAILWRRPSEDFATLNCCRVVRNLGQANGTRATAAQYIRDAEAFVKSQVAEFQRCGDHVLEGKYRRMLHDFARM